MSDYNKGLLNEPCLRLPYGFGEEVESVELGDGTGYVRLSDYEKLKAENAELREDIAKARDPQRISGQADPESFIYAIEQLREFRWQHATNDEDAIPYINKVAEAHERENEKLREDLEFERSENGWAREFLDRMGRKCGTKDCPSLVAYVNKLEATNAKLRRAFAETLLRLAAANEATVSDYMDDHYCEMLRELGIEVDE